MPTNRVVNQELGRFGVSRDSVTAIVGKPSGKAFSVIFAHKPHMLANGQSTPLDSEDGSPTDAASEDENDAATCPALPESSTNAVSDAMAGHARNVHGLSRASQQSSHCRRLRISPLAPRGRNLCGSTRKPLSQLRSSHELAPWMPGH